MNPDIPALQTPKKAPKLVFQQNLIEKPKDQKERLINPQHVFVSPVVERRNKRMFEFGDFSNTVERNTDHRHLDLDIRAYSIFTQRHKARNAFDLATLKASIEKHTIIGDQANKQTSPDQYQLYNEYLASMEVDQHYIDLKESILDAMYQTERMTKIYNIEFIYRYEYDIQHIGDTDIEFHGKRFEVANICSIDEAINRKDHNHLTAFYKSLLDERARNRQVDEEGFNFFKLGFARNIAFSRLKSFKG